MVRTWRVPMVYLLPNHLPGPSREAIAWPLTAIATDAVAVATVRAVASGLPFAELYQPENRGFHKWGYPQMDGLEWTIPKKINDLGVHLFQETSKSCRSSLRCLLVIWRWWGITQSLNDVIGVPTASSALKLPRYQWHSSTKKKRTRAKCCFAPLAIWGEKSWKGLFRSWSFMSILSNIFQRFIQYSSSNSYMRFRHVLPLSFWGCSESATSLGTGRTDWETWRMESFWLV